LVTEAENAKQRGSARADRFEICLPVRYRLTGESDWLEGSSENMSRTWILMRVARLPDRETKLELAFTLAPSPKSGYGARVVCTAKIASQEHRPRRWEFAFWNTARASRSRKLVWNSKITGFRSGRLALAAAAQLHVRETGNNSACAGSPGQEEMKVKNE
jgi:hypothetical protein